MGSSLLSAATALILALTLAGVQVQAWDSLLADIGESCAARQCKAEKHLICVQGTCQCKIDEINSYPWQYIEKLKACVPVFRGPAEAGAQAQHAGSNHPGHGGNNGGYPGQGGNNGGYPGQGGNNGGYPGQGGNNGGFPGTGWELPVGATKIDYSNCRREVDCGQYGDLARCNLGSQYCYCEAFKEQTGFYNGKCHLSYGQGRNCEYDAQCIVGNFGNRESACKKDRRRPGERICVTGHASGIVISITLFLFGLIATRFVGA